MNGERAPATGPDFEEARRFLSALTGEPEPVVTFQAIPDSPEQKRSGFARVRTGPLRQHWPELRELNEEGYGIFLMVNKGDGRGRKTENVTGLRALFLDDDGQGRKDYGLPPSIVVETSPGKRHVYWTLAPGEPLEGFTPAQKLLAERFGTDPAVSDLPRVLRVPGFEHRKGEPRKVRLLSASEERHTVAEVLRRNGAAEARRDPGPPAGEGAAAPEAAPTTAEEPLTFERPAPTPRELFEDFRRLPDALAVLAKHYGSKGKLGYNEWTREIVAPLQGSFGGTDYWPVVQGWFADFTRQLPGYRKGDERKLGDFKRAGGPRRTVASIYGLADRLSAGWRGRAAVEEDSRARAHVPVVATPGAELLDRPVELPDYLIYPYVARGATHGMFGAGGALKTAVELDELFSVATGHPWAGNAVARGRVLHLSKEQPLRSVRGRLEAWLYGVTFGLEGRELEERMRELRALLGENLLVAGQDSPGAQELLVTVPHGSGVRVNERALDDLSRLAEGRALVAVETLSLLHSGTENANDAAAMFVGALARVASRTGAAVQFTGHVGKDPKSGQYPARGASAFEDNSRGAFEVQRTGTAPLAGVKLVHVKPFEDGPRGDTLAWQPQVWRPTWSEDARGYVYLVPTTAGALDQSAWRPKLVAELRAAGADGLDRTELGALVSHHRNRAEQQAAMLDALQGLIDEGRVEKKAEQRKATGRPATVYRVAGAESFPPNLPVSLPAAGQRTITGGGVSRGASPRTPSRLRGRETNSAPRDTPGAAPRTRTPGKHPPFSSPGRPPRKGRSAA